MMNISLYIPRVFSNISKEFVANTFQKLGIGKVSHVDFVYKKGANDMPYNSTYVHFEYWFDNEVARNFYVRVIHPEKEARIVYDDPWYWVVLENKGKTRMEKGYNPSIHWKTVLTKPSFVPPPPPHVSYEQLKEIENTIDYIRNELSEYESVNVTVKKDSQELFVNLYAQEAYYLVYYQFYQKLYKQESEFYEEEELEDYEDYMDENMSIS